jgi:hypothetical protein|tara:strand:+ start:15663 stop:16058 length:396 start_codon:yes stop_codon:yes gene_type:complete
VQYHYLLSTGEIAGKYPDDQKVKSDEKYGILVSEKDIDASDYYIQDGEFKRYILLEVEDTGNHIQIESNEYQGKMTLYAEYDDGREEETEIEFKKKLKVKHKNTGLEKLTMIADTCKPVSVTLVGTAITYG